jgi:hypothetical protein
MSARIRRRLVAVAVVVSMAVAGCGSAAASASVAPSVISGASSGPSVLAQGNSGGVADTPANPDRSYVCAAVADDSAGQPIGYVTVAGTDDAAARAECSGLPAGSGWKAVASSPFHETQYTPVCFVIFDAGRLTARVYTSDTGTFAQGVALCNPILSQFAVPTLPPS